MTELLTAAQMRAIEAAAIASGEVTGLALMERAGRGVVEAIWEEWPDLAKAPHRAVVLCGPGNNGGDGFVVARLLRDWGWEVEVFLYGQPERLPPDARTNFERWTGMGVVTPLGVEAAAAGQRPALLVDAMFGTGLTRAIPLECANAFHAVGNRKAGNGDPRRVPYRVVAVDCPSGLDCDSGRFLLPEGPDNPEQDPERHRSRWQGDASRRILCAQLTVTFHRRKLGHYLCNPPAGALRVVDIGLGREDRHPAHLMRQRPVEVACLLDFELPGGASRSVWPGQDLDKASRRGAVSHKYTHGHALILSGGPGRGGAARLAARGALRIGAGLVTVACPPAALQENAARLDAIMLKPVHDADALARILEDSRISALCLGPGLGTGEREAALVAGALGVPGARPPPSRDLEGGGRGRREDRPSRDDGEGEARDRAGAG